GDSVRLGGSGRVTAARVAAIFDGVGSPASPFWASVSSVVKGVPSTPPPVFASASTFVDLLSGIGGSGRLEWDVPLRTHDLSLAAAGTLAARLQVLRQEAQDPNTALGASFHTDRFGIAAPYASTRLPALVDRADDISR